MGKAGHPVTSSRGSGSGSCPHGAAEHAAQNRRGCGTKGGERTRSPRALSVRFRRPRSGVGCVVMVAPGSSALGLGARVVMFAGGGVQADALVS